MTENRRTRRGKGKGPPRSLDRNQAIRHALHLVQGGGARPRVIPLHRAERTDGVTEIQVPPKSAPEQYAEYLATSLATFDAWEKQKPEAERCPEMEKVAIAMRVMCNRVIQFGVDVDEFLKIMQAIYEQQEDQLRAGHETPDE
jgi:hypothetical protein